MSKTEKLDVELKEFDSLCEQAKSSLQQMLTGNETYSVEEVKDMAEALGYVVDMKKDMAEICYKKVLIEAMEENKEGYGKSWDENGVKFYSKNSNMMPMNDMEEYRIDPMRMTGYMDMPKNVHYYTEGGMGYRGDGNIRMGTAAMENVEKYEARIDNARIKGYEDGNSDGYRRGYTDGMNDSSRSGSGSNNNGNSMNSSRYENARRNYTENHDMPHLEEWVNTISDELMEKVSTMNPNEKAMLKNKITQLANSIH